MGIFDKNKFGSVSIEYETPLSLFEPLNAEFSFDIDVCATHENKKVNKCYTKEENGLKQDWVGNCWCNPPYGREMIDWIKKAISTKEKGHGKTVMLIPARTNTGWWHDFVMPNAEIRFIRGRPKFNNGKHGLPQPLAIAIF